MSRATLDQMIEFATTEVASQDRDKLKSLVRRMAGKWPQEKALGLAFALTSAAASLKTTSTTKKSSQPWGRLTGWLPWSRLMSSPSRPWGTVPPSVEISSTIGGGSIRGSSTTARNEDV